MGGSYPCMMLVRNSGRLHRNKLPAAINPPSYLSDEKFDNPRLAVDSFVVNLRTCHYRSVAVDTYGRFARFNYAGDRSQARCSPCFVGYDSVGHDMYVVIAKQLLKRGWI